MKVLLICFFILPIIINYLPQPVLSQKEHYCGDITDCTRALGVHSTCNKYGRCICAINYHEKATPENGNEKKTSCERMSSCGGLDLTCMSRYGMHSKCSKSNGELCFCEEGYRFDTASRQCAVKSGGESFGSFKISTLVLVGIGVYVGCVVAKAIVN